MYINRKTGELVEAEYCIEDGFWDVEDLNGNRINTLNEPDFFAQYGEAMVKTIGTVHIKNECCEMGYCIPYIPEEYDVNNEPTFPICGTCNARKSNLSWLMLTPEQLNKVVWRYTDKEKQTYALGTIIKEIAKAQINHLAKPEFGIFKLIDGEFIRFEHYLKENEK